MSALEQGWLTEERLPHSTLFEDKKDELRRRKQQNSGRTAELAPMGPITPHKTHLWKAIDHVYIGNHTDISLWEWKSRVFNLANSNRYVIIKTQKNGHKLEQEGQMMARIIRENRTDHLVRMVYQAEDYRVLYLEYCLGGDLQDDILHRQRGGQSAYYTEEHLWRMFLCLIKGVRSLGDDPDAPTILHLRLRPENILIGDVEDEIIPGKENHTCSGGHQILKIGDFGSAFLWTPEPEWPSENMTNEDYRKRFLQPHEIGSRGAHGYQSPEQRFLMREDQNPTFSLDWQGWFAWEADYGYSHKTNIWGIAAIMWQLVCLKSTSPLNQERYPNDNHFIHTIKREADNIIPKIELVDIETYGGGITCPSIKTRYPSHNCLLIDIILWCLAEKPILRPSNSVLFDVVQSVCNEYDAKSQLGSSSKSSPYESTSTGFNRVKSLLKDKIESEILPPNPDGAARTWTKIPNIFAVPNPMMPDSNASTPKTPDIELPGGRVPYSPPLPSPRKLRQGRPRGNAFEDVDFEVPKKVKPSSLVVKSLPKPREIRLLPGKRSKLTGFFCVPCYYGPYLARVAWIMFFFTGLSMTAFCIFYAMLVDYHDHL